MDWYLGLATRRYSGSNRDVKRPPHIKPPLGERELYCAKCGRKIYGATRNDLDPKYVAWDKKQKNFWHPDCKPEPTAPTPVEQIVPEHVLKSKKKGNQAWRKRNAKYLPFLGTALVAALVVVLML